MAESTGYSNSISEERTDGLSPLSIVTSLHCQSFVNNDCPPSLGFHDDLLQTALHSASLDFPSTDDSPTSQTTPTDIGSISFSQSFSSEYLDFDSLDNFLDSLNKDNKVDNSCSGGLKDSAPESQQLAKAPETPILDAPDVSTQHLSYPSGYVDSSGYASLLDSALDLSLLCSTIQRDNCKVIQSATPTPPVTLPQSLTYPPQSQAASLQCESVSTNLSLDNLKPSESFIALVAKAIMSSPEETMILTDIYQWVLDNYPYYRTATNAWRNSIRHSLSANECFVKGRRAKGGRGFYWSIHASCLETFRQGNFDRRLARRTVQHSSRNVGTAVQELKKLRQDTTNNNSPSTVAVPSPQTGSLHHHGNPARYQPMSSTPLRPSDHWHTASSDSYSQHFTGFQSASYTNLHQLSTSWGYSY